MRSRTMKTVTTKKFGEYGYFTVVDYKSYGAFVN